MDDAEIIPNGSDILGSARTRARTSPPKQTVEVITRGARRNWRPEEKREIVLASLAPGSVPSAICRQHGIGSGQLSVWRQQLREGKLGHPSSPALNFAQAVVIETRSLPMAEELSPICDPPAPRARRQRPREDAPTRRRGPRRSHVGDAGSAVVCERDSYAADAETLGRAAEAARFIS